MAAIKTLRAITKKFGRSSIGKGHNRIFSTTKTKNLHDDEYEENIKEKILGASLPFVKELGWGRDSISKGAESLGYPGITNGIFPNSEAELIHFFNKHCNQELVQYMENKSLEQSLKLDSKKFVEEAVKKRLSMIIPYIDQWPQALGILSLPPNVPTSLKNFFCLIDDICYYSGDKSTDFSWYCKRLTVSGIYKATELYLIQDKSKEYRETWEFLNRRTHRAFQMQTLVQNSSQAAETAGDVLLATVTTTRSILRLNQQL